MAESLLVPEKPQKLEGIGQNFSLEPSDNARRPMWQCFSRTPFPGRLSVNSKVVALTSFLFFNALRSTAGGTYSSGFEEFPVGTAPTFALPNSINSAVQVASSLAPSVPSPYEGSHFLGVKDSALISAPDREPIASFSLYLYVAPSTGLLLINAGTVSGDPAAAGSWQKLTGQFATPVQSFSVSAQFIQGETFYPQFGVDNLTLVTVPEPSTSGLLTVAFGMAFLAKFGRAQETDFGKPKLKCDT